jgi:hypothetical protein
MMRNFKRYSVCLLSLVLAAGVEAGWGQAQLQQIQSSQGGAIYYGTVDNANTQPAALIGLLRMVHKNCGERPRIVKVFKLPGTDSIGLFFTVVNHTQGNSQVAGLMIAAPSAPNQVQAAMIANQAGQFNQAMNPMLRELLNVWHPGRLATAFSPAQGADSGSRAGSGQVAGSSKAGGAHGAAASAHGATASAHAAPGSGHYAPAAKLHMVSTSDNAASIGIPDGWRLDPQSGGGTVRVVGPKGEMILLNGSRNAIDPTSPNLLPFQRNPATRAPGTIAYPYHGDLVRDFPNLFQLWRRAGGNPPTQVQIDSIEPKEAPQGEKCVHAEGYLDPNGNKTHMSSLMCVFDPGQTANYMITFNNALLPAALFDQEHLTMVGIVSSFKVNQQVIGQQQAAAIDNIHRIGQQAAADRASRNAANDAQHAAYWAQQGSNAAQHAEWNAGQDNNARNGQGFSNYIRDETVVRDVQEPNEHVTVYNSTAAALQQTFPDRVEEVPTSQYISGTDY